MALTDNPNTKHRKPKIRAIDAKTNRSWSDKQKLEAVQHWLLLGNLALTSRLLGIPEITLRVWKTTEWWKNVVDDIKLQEDMQMSAKLKKIVEASLGAVEDRLTNGDWIYDQKSGQMIRKQVNMKDAHKVAVDLMDKKTVLEKAAAPLAVEQKDDDRLLKLAEKFADFVNKKREPVPLAERVDVEDSVFTEDTPITVEEKHNAIHEEREEGLQTGEPPVQQQTGTTESSQ